MYSLALTIRFSLRLKPVRYTRFCRCRRQRLGGINRPFRLGRMRRRGEVVVARDELLSDVGNARDRLKAMQDRGEVCVSPFMQRDTPAAILDRALAAWRYHGKTVARDLGPEIICDDPPLLLYYQNRMVPFAERVAAEKDIAAAREIADIGRGL